MKKLSYLERVPLFSNRTAKRLFQLIEEKKTNLAVSLDIKQSKRFLELVDEIGSEICLLKTHIDIIEDFSNDFIKALQALSIKHTFLILEDRKFADIGNTVKYQYQDGIYHIVDWADIVTAHSISGPGIITALKEVGLTKDRGLLLIAEMSSEANLIYENYIESTVEIATRETDFVIGLIAQRHLTKNPKLIHLMPGVQLSVTNDAFDQRYTDPQKASLDNEADIIIVGRGIYAAESPLKSAQHYRELAWEAYCKLL